MNTHYLQLTLEQRYQIWALRDSGKTQREIAAVVGVHDSTVSRKLRRNQTKKGYHQRLKSEAASVGAGRTRPASGLAT